MEKQIHVELEKRFEKLELSLEEKQQMEKPLARFSGPYTIRGLEPGKKYKYCTCGLSSTEPFCDNSHKGTKFKPIVFTAKDQVMVQLCGCKRNCKERVGVYCDGSHSGW